MSLEQVYVASCTCISVRKYVSRCQRPFFRVQNTSVGASVGVYQILAFGNYSVLASDKFGEYDMELFQERFHSWILGHVNPACTMETRYMSPHPSEQLHRYMDLNVPGLLTLLGHDSPRTCRVD